jgi:hypothetical protein
LRLKPGKLVIGELTVKRLTLSEIQDAGIDTSAPENQFVYKFEVHLAFNNQPLTNNFIVNGNGAFLGAYSPITIGGGYGGGGGGGGYGGGSGYYTAYPVAIPHPSHPEVRPTVAYMVIPAEARWLKEFFEVGLTLENTADPEFVLADSTATLRLPDGLVLAPTRDPQSLRVSLGDIAGQETREVKWIIRGDQKGTYNLEAEFNGILKPFEENISTVFKTQEPFRVWGDDAIKIHVDAQERADMGAPYHVRFGIENVADVPVYNPAIELKDATKQNYIYGPNQELVKMQTELPAGETFWSDYWLIPAITGTLDLSKSFTLKTGINDVEVPCEITSRSDPENYPPAVPVLSQVRHDDGTVTLTWDPIEGALGYKIYSIRSDLMISKDPGELVYTAGPGEHTKILTETDGEKDYVINTLIPSGDSSVERLKHAITGLSWCASAGNPVISVDPEELTAGVTSDMLLTVNQNGFPVGYGTVDIGDLIKDQPLDSKGQARVTVTPVAAGNLVITAYDLSGKVMATRSIKVLADTKPPKAPTGLKATINTGGISLYWNTNMETDLAGYNLYRLVGTEWVKFNTELFDGTIYNVTGLSTSKSYTFRVTAVDRVGNESEMSEQVATPPAVVAFTNFKTLSLPVALKGASDCVVDSLGNVYVTDYYNNRIVMFDSTGKFSKAYGTYGTGVGQFYKPNGIGVDELDNIYVTDSYNNRVVMFKDSNGNGTIESSEWQAWGGPASGSGVLEFNKPMGVSAKDNIVYVADTYNHRIAIFDISDPEGTWRTIGSVGAADGQFKVAYDVAVDSKGNIWVSDSLNNRVQKFANDGTYLEKYSASLPYGIAVDENDNVFIVERQTALVKCVNAAATYGGKTKFKSPIGIFVDKNGMMWIIDVTTSIITTAPVIPE